MNINRFVVVLDAADIDAESAFWAGVLGGTVAAYDDWHMVVVDDQSRLAVQLAPDHVRPEWPDGPQRQQIHLDLWVDDIGPAHEHVMSLGAQLLKEVTVTDPPDPFQVYADPAGHPFCLCWRP
jgi:catechol 2,3-dioxygenase-like lactoylglutathione lyase family enzyme